MRQVTAPASRRQDASWPQTCQPANRGAQGEPQSQSLTPKDGRATQASGSRPVGTLPTSRPLAAFGQALTEEFGRAFDRFSTLQRDASDEVLLFGLAHPDLREEMLAVLEHELVQAVDSVRRCRRFSQESEVDDASF